MTLADDYERDSLCEYPEDRAASDDEIENSQYDLVSCTEPLSSITRQNSDTDFNKHVAEESEGRCYGNSCKSCFSCVFKVL